MSLKFVDKEELVLRFLTLESSIDSDLRLVGSILERIGRSKRELEMIKEELEERNV